ncbi:hypothetical protein I5M27_00885 [Adhaeribacter sp. BT258]|uniref:DUF4136 domain-containing protein n=1 Tax=Adhaeribacter terrigena TaxID=2793070 RepID=A0ABS1BWK4_9BACT|nr:hypothetical protein [Adhaeribacter terrigena]MBK0401516.1 hypothetical protein [Adhaeribacter terrigena]
MQFFRRIRYRFFYPAGLISLVLLPVLGYIYLDQKGAFHQEYIIEVTLWNPPDTPPDQFNENPEFNVSPASIRKFKTILLNGNQLEDEHKLQQAQKEIHQLMINKDTISGIHLIYGPKATYGTMISGLNICLEEQTIVNWPNVGWSIYSNNLWVFYRDVDYSQLFTCGTEYEAYTDLKEKNNYQVFTDLIKEEICKSISSLKQAKSFWPAGILYIIMVSLTARKAVRRLRNQPFNH